MATKAEKLQSFRNLIRKVERSNEKFDRADQAGKILMVSQDILDLLKLQRLEAQCGIYVEIPEIEAFHQEPSDGSPVVQVQDILKMPEIPACSVCAIGAGMLACTLRLDKAVVRKDNIEYGDTMSFCSTATSRSSFTSDVMSHNASSVFGLELLRTMEAAFEGGEYGYGRLQSDKGRLCAIYQNLVDNKGKKFTNYRSGKDVYVVQA